MSNENDLRPFRFEDLQGKPEPELWGPRYPVLPSVEKWRKIDRTRPLSPAEESAYAASIGAAVRLLQRQELCGSAHAAIDLRSTQFDAARHRAKIAAQFAIQAATDRRLWAKGQIKSGMVGDWGLTIGQVYERDLKAKRAAAAATMREAA